MPLTKIFNLFTSDKPTKMSAYEDLNRSKPPVTLPNTIEDLFWSHNGTVVHKWHHYLPIYDTYLKEYQNKPIKFLEIGVSKGGSLSIWRKFFGADATIFGVDIDPNCKKYNGLDGQVRIGSQDDPEFISEVIKEMGGVDVILDDGSHISSHIRATFEIAFPLLNNGGLYIVEDLHATYWRSHGGGYKATKSFMSDIAQMYDDMHHWYHNHGQKISASKDQLFAIHLYDSLAIFEKNTVMPPKHTKIGAH